MKHLYFLEVDNRCDIPKEILDATIAAALIDAMRDEPITIKLELGGTINE